MEVELAKNKWWYGKIALVCKLELFFLAFCHDLSWNCGTIEVVVEWEMTNVSQFCQRKRVLLLFVEMLICEGV